MTAPDAPDTAAAPQPAPAAAGGSHDSARTGTPEQPALTGAAGELAPAATFPGGQPAGSSVRPTSRGARRVRRVGQSSTIPVVVAVVVTILMQQLINTAVPVDAYLYRLFRPAGGWIMSVVPGLIAFVLIWTLTDLTLKFRLGRTNERDLGRQEIKQLPNVVRHEPTSITLQRLRSRDPALMARPVGRRILWLLHHIDTVDPQRAHELVRHQSDLEADSAASAYRTVKLFIWAMPILGFIGTVLGISLAVGGFSDFLTTNVSIDEIDAVTAELGEVASGLSFAFDTTLLGLLAGLVASVASSGVQSREERLLTRLEEFGLGIMANARSGGAAARVVGSSGFPAEEFDEMMQNRLEELSVQMELFSKSVQSGLDGFLGQWAKLPPEVERVAGDLTGLREHLERAVRSTDSLVSETLVLMEGVNEASSHMTSGLETSMGSIRHAVAGVGDNLRGVSDSLSIRMAEMEESNERLAAALAATSDKVAHASDRLHAGVQAQVSAEQAIKQLSSSVDGFGARLDELRVAHAALAPVLNKLMGPLELRIAPVSSVQASFGGTTGDDGRGE